MVSPSMGEGGSKYLPGENMAISAYAAKKVVNECLC